MFSEKLVYLPNSYYVNSHMLAFHATPPHSLQTGAPGADAAAIRRARREQGLPPLGPVLCNFNQIYKVDGDTFRSWLKVLQSQPNATLWLRTEGEETHKVLRKVAKRHGVGAARIVFASWAPTSAQSQSSAACPNPAGVPPRARRPKITRPSCRTPSTSWTAGASASKP